MNDLKFNINGMLKPTSRAEYVALLMEADRLADELLEQLDSIESILASKADKLPA